MGGHKRPKRAPVASSPTTPTAPTVVEPPAVLATPTEAPILATPTEPATPIPAPPPVAVVPAPPPPSRQPAYAGIAAVLAVAALVTIVAGLDDDTEPAAMLPLPPVVVAAPRHHRAAPAARPPNRFIGSAACGECHDDELAAWKKSWHFRALSPATPKFVVGNFARAHFAGTSSEATMSRLGATSIMRAAGPDGSPSDFKIDWVIGGKRMQDDVTVFPDGRWQVLPVYFHVTGNAWVDYTETKQGPLTPDHPFYWTNVRRMANHECLDCHSTDLRVAFDGTWHTAMTDTTVACEACHGPGGKHVDAEGKGHIIQPAKAGEVGVAACARCHGPHNPVWPLLDTEHRFQPGDAYDEFYDPIEITLADGQSSDFFVDGRPRTSSFEYQAMLQSACYRKGGATCLTCHTAPHEPHGHAELRKAPTELCKGCHADIGPTHSHHKTATCVGCHMPPVVSGVLDHFADHALDVPAPQIAERHAVPDACGACHADKQPAELAAKLAAWWPDAGKRQERRARLADAFDDATAADSAKPLVATIRDRGEAPTVRGAAMITLGRRFGPSTAPILVPLLADASIVIRSKACEALALAHAQVAGDALANLLDDGSVRVRLAASLALFDLKDARGEPALHELADDPATSHLMIPHHELGMMLGRQRDFAGARKELEQVATLAPTYVDGLVELAGVDAELGDLAAARTRLSQALTLEPKHRSGLALAAKLQSVR